MRTSFIKPSVLINIYVILSYDTSEQNRTAEADNGTSTLTQKSPNPTLSSLSGCNFFR